jgi:ketosteroid isomerase-like protein
MRLPRHPAVAYFFFVRCMATRTAATVFLLIALAACGKWSDKRLTESVEQVISQVDNERIQAQIHADATALDRIYAADFIGVGPSGRVRTKPEVISDFTSGDLKFQSITTDDVQVRIYGNTAVETGRSTMNGQDKGQTVPRDTRFTRVWVKQQGRWQLVANHYSSQTTRQ